MTRRGAGRREAAGRWPLALHRSGFTLIEVIVVMAIVAILSAIAIPSYLAYIQRSNRSDARNQILMLSQWMERFRNENSRYDNPLAFNTPPVIPAGLMCSPTIPNPGCVNYTIAIAAATAGTYTLTATPVVGGPMAGDVCGVLSLTNTGVRAPVAPPICWDR